MSLTGTPVPGTVLAGRYRIQNRVATGGFGQLYVAEQLAMGRLVAVKRIHADLAEEPTALERFRLEARAACQVTHPNLVVYHDFGEDEGGTPFLVMEYIRGRTLSELLRATPVLPLSRAVHIVEQMCSALAAAHEAGIVHRDLKPGNVMLLRQGEDPDFVKIIDFGILKRTGEFAVEGRVITRTDEIVGTPEYLAPEIIRGRPFDGRADQYAIGVMFYEMLAGKRPFQGADVIATLMAQARDEAPPLAEVTKGRFVSTPIDTVLQRAMEKEPEARYPTMRAFASALREAAAPYLEEEHAAPTARAERAGVLTETRRLEPETKRSAETSALRAEEPPRSRAKAWLAALATLVVAAALGVLLWPETGQAPAPEGPATQTGGAEAPRSADTVTVTRSADVAVGLTGTADVSVGSRADTPGGPDVEPSPDAASTTTTTTTTNGGAAPSAVKKVRKALGHGTLRVSVRPKGHIWIDGRPVSSDGRWQGRVTAKRHRVRVAHDGRAQEKRITVKAGGEETVLFDLR